MTDYYKTVDAEWYKSRLVLTVFFVAVAFIVLLLRLFFLQIIKGPEYRRLSENNCIRLQKTEPLRGLIFDRKGHRLVDNRPAFDLNIIPRDVGSISDTFAGLAHLTGYSPEVLKEKYDRNRGPNSYKPVPLLRDVSRNILAIVEAHSFDLPGVVMNFKPRRHYLYDSFAAHLIGYLGEISREEIASGDYTGYEAGNYIGKCGIEKRYDNLLRGKSGGRQVEVNASGQVVRVLKTVPAVPGDNIYLTIDFALQRHMEELLAGRAGAAVALDPLSGEVLAMVSQPDFNQNHFVDGMSRQQWKCLIENPYRPMENKVVQAEYPPASVYKIVTAMAALEEEVVDAEEVIDCPGYYKYGNRIFRCWDKKGHGRMNMVEALSQSCDVYFYQVGVEVGVERLAWYAKACGLGRPTGINMAGETNGLVPTKKWKKHRSGQPWIGGDTINLSIGQGYNLVTPMQMAVLIAAIANGGTIKRPLLVKKIETVEGETVHRSRPEDRGTLPAGETTLAIIRRGLHKVVNDRQGTAWYSVHADEVDISGKTGTAQVVASPQDLPGETAEEREVAETFKPHAWFVAYAPSEFPVIAVAVLVEHGEHGSTTAGPIARKIIEAYLQKGKSFLK